VIRRLLIPLLLISAFFLQGDEPMTPTIQEVKRKHEATLLSLPGVVSVGIGRGPDGEIRLYVAGDLFVRLHAHEVEALQELLEDPKLFA